MHKVKDERELWREEKSGLWGDVSLGGGRGLGGCVHLILWIAACSGLTGCGGSKCCPIFLSSSGITLSQSHFIQCN